MHDAADHGRVVQRVYGITFPDKKSLEDYKHRMEEAKRRDHRNVGKQMELFHFHELSPGSCFFAPNGARIYNSLIEVGILSQCTLMCLCGKGSTTLSV